MKPVILTGLRANNDLTIGNYFGGILPLVTMANTRSHEYNVNIFVPDLHSFTTPVDHGQLYEGVLKNLRMYTAAGLPLDNPSVYVYRQSYISAHSELTWILDCFTGMGEMRRMTQYKEKAGKMSGDSVSVGLFNYPVLMAADILLYQASYVPVGDDQTQHLEFARDIAQRMNSKFQQDLFTVPHEVSKQNEFFGKDSGLRIMDLQDPSKKMSKSDESEKGVIFLSDAPEVASKKIMSAATDSVGKISYDRQAQPGIANLIEIYALIEKVSPQEITERYSGETMYGGFKKDLAEKMSAFLSDLQTKLATVSDDVLMGRVEACEAVMQEAASTTLYRVQQAVGLRR